LTDPTLPSWTSSLLGVGLLTFGYFAMNYLARFRRVTTAAEARQRRLNARGEKALKRWCKRHPEFMPSIINGEREVPFRGGVLHMTADQETLEKAAKNAKAWQALWDDETAHPPRKGTCGVSPRHRVEKYLRPNQPARCGSSRRGKAERPWANPWNSSLLGAMTSSGKEPELPGVVGFDPERVGAIPDRVHELFKSEIGPIVLKT